MNLIITEKRDVAKLILGVIDGQRFTDKGGYWQSKDYYICCCSGHLYGLVAMDKYFPVQEDGKKRRWNLADLPFIPEGYKFKYEIAPPRTSQFGTQDPKKMAGIINDLANRPEVTAIYHYGDADREGEVIIRHALKYNLKTQKPIYRMWCDDTMRETINNALAAKVPDSHYDNLYAAGITRAYIDWLFGINMTRYLSLKANASEVLRFGRCKIAIVSKIVEREQEIKKFVPETYYGVASKADTNGETIELTSKRTFKKNEKADATQYAGELNTAGAVVTDVETSRKKVAAKSLFDTSTLTGAVIAAHKEIGPSQVDDALEHLYQRGYTTYPRTKSAYLTSSESEKVDGILQRLADKGFTGLVNKPKATSIYNDKKVEGHSAIIVTGNIPDGLSEIEQAVYSMIFDRFMAVFCAEDRTVDRTIITIQCGEETFMLKGDVEVTPGWAVFEKPGQGDKILPKLNKGDKVNIDFKPVDKQTSPPKRFTVESFSRWCVAPWRKDESDSTEYTDDEWKRILSDASVCTGATRNKTITECCDNHYISIRKGSFYAEEFGFLLMDVVKQLEVDFTVGETMALSKQMFDVSKGTKTIRECLDTATQKLNAMFEHRDVMVNIDPKFAYAQGNKSLPVLCKCGHCDGDIVETGKGYFCVNKCGNRLLKQSAYMEKTFNIKFVKPEIAKKLMTGGEIPVKCVSEKGVTYMCMLHLDFSTTGEVVTKEDGTTYKKPPGFAREFGMGCKCPVCGGNISEWETNFACQNHDFVIWKKTKHFNDEITINTPILKKLLAGKSAPVKLTSKAGKKYDADMRLDGTREYKGKIYPNFVFTPIKTEKPGKS